MLFISETLSIQYKRKSLGPTEASTKKRRTQENKPIWLYHLLLEDECHYGGKSKEVEKRFTQHLKGNGAIWTKIHRPIRIVEKVLASSIAKDPNYAEDIFTKTLMDKYGIDKVRGASYCQEKLHEYQVENLKNEFRSRNDRCYNCGQKDHIARFCKNESDQGDFSYSEDEEEDEFSAEEDERVKVCPRCDRELVSHTSGKCYWRTHANGSKLSSSPIFL